MIDSPQVFIIGKISGGQFFDNDQLYVKYGFKVGDNWKLISGQENGETFTSISSNNDFVPFEHPFDLNYSTKSVRGWPKLMVEAWEIDNDGRNSLAGYGITTLPFDQGEFKLDIPCWRPKAEFFDKLIGAYPELVYKDMLLTNESRLGFKAETTGKIFIELSIITKDFHLHGVQTSKQQF